jgi:DNA polymerase III epsilon subunit-like protein
MFITPDHHRKGRKPKDFRDRKLIFIDLEMTGLDPDRHEIIEIGWLVVKPRTFKIISEFETKVKPEHIETASEEGLKVAGYSQEKWENAMDLKKVIQKLARVAPNAMLAGSVVWHDWEFLERAFERYKIDPKITIRILPIDALAYIKLYNQDKLKHLGMRSGVANYFGIKFSEQHGALVDAKLSYEVFKKLMEVE